MLMEWNLKPSIDMTKEEKIVQIAKACGWWGNIQIVDGDVMGRPPNMTDRFERVPDYFNDLNAMHEAEKVLLAMDDGSDAGCLRYVYAAHLYNDIVPSNVQPIMATAEQRAEAFGRTLNLW